MKEAAKLGHPRHLEWPGHRSIIVAKVGRRLSRGVLTSSGPRQTSPPPRTIVTPKEPCMRTSRLIVVALLFRPAWPRQGGGCSVLPEGRRPGGLLRRQHHRPASLHHIRRDVCGHTFSQANVTFVHSGWGGDRVTGGGGGADRRPTQSRRDRLQADGRHDHAWNERRQLPRRFASQSSIPMPRLPAQWSRSSRPTLPGVRLTLSQALAL